MKFDIVKEHISSINIKTLREMINPTFSSGSLCNRKRVEEEREQERIYKELKLYGQCLALKPSGRSIYSLFSSII